MEIPNYALEYDERLDALTSLELLIETLSKVLTSPHYWKWVILSLHNALQAFMVLSLQGTNSLNVLTEKSSRKWLEAYEDESIPDAPLKLDNFQNLYSKIKSDSMLIWTNSKRFTPTASQDASVIKLNAFRNDFVHYIPADTLLDVRVWLNLIVEIVPIIEFLVFESNNIFLDDEEKEQKVKGLCALAKSQAKTMIDYYS